MNISSFDHLLAPYAQKNATSRGRIHPEPDAEDRLPFQRDRDRIIHTTAFRRLQGKTQVFSPHKGDHYRNRLTHTIEVAQISRDLARWLGLNEDLAEAIALGHDLGHPPFGHAGEWALEEKMKQFDMKFEHNEQSLRIVTFFENRYPNFRGLNLTFEVLDGLQKHSSSFDRPNGIIYSPHLEAQLVDISDEITYLSADLEDALRAHIIDVQGLQTVPILKDVIQETLIDGTLDRSSFIRKTIKKLIHKLRQDTKKNIEHYKIHTIEDVQKTPQPIIMYEKEFYKQFLELKQFLLENYYQSTSVKDRNIFGQNIISRIFDHLLLHPQLIPKEFIPEETNQQQKICDYIAGMTDNFALDFYRQNIDVL